MKTGLSGKFERQDIHGGRGQELWRSLAAMAARWKILLLPDIFVRKNGISDAKIINRRCDGRINLCRILMLRKSLLVIDIFIQICFYVSWT